MSYLVINEDDIITNWESVDPVLLNKVVGIEVNDDNNIKIRIGNDIDVFSDLHVMWSGTKTEFESIFTKISEKVQNVIDTNISISAAIKNVTDISTQMSVFNEHKIRQIMGVDL